jgi:uncharacterized protein YfaS (alpha-2-macroglobulin family)
MMLQAKISGYYISAVDLLPVMISISRSEGCKLGPRKMFRDIVYAGAYRQMAKIIVPVGDAGRYRARHVHGILDIMPDAANLVTGMDISLTLLYEGKAVSGVGVCAISKKDGISKASGKTDDNGIVRLPVPGDGTLMFLARYRDRSKFVEDEYDETIFVTTLVMGTVPS